MDSINFLIMTYESYLIFSFFILEMARKNIEYLLDGTFEVEKMNVKTSLYRPVIFCL